jgi:transcriptional regulator with XRE-family HTH domain
MFNAEKLRIYRKAVGLTQQQLADRAGCDRNTVSRVEIGKLKPSDDLAGRLAGVLGVEVDALRIARPTGEQRPAEPPRPAGSDLSRQELQTLHVLRRLTPEARRQVLRIASGLAAGLDLPSAVELAADPPGGRA